MGRKSIIPYWGHSALNSILAVIYPTLCWGCGRTIPSQKQVLCVVCASNLRETEMDGDLSNFLLHQHHLIDFPLFKKGGALFFFEDNTPTQRLIHLLKFLQHQQVGTWIGKVLANKYHTLNFFDDIDTIIPLPIHPQREKERGYNQSQIISDSISVITQKPVESHLIQRSKRTNPQATIHSQNEREANIKGAFLLAEDVKAFENKHLLLIDDVLTTGATISECARTLHQIKGVQISFLTFAITVA